MNYLKATWNYRQQVIFLAQQTVKKQYLGTAFGSFWSITQPFAYMLTFSLFFIYTGKNSSEMYGVPFILLLFAANTPWMMLSQTLTQGSKVFNSNGVLIKTIRFPVMALPLAEVLAKTYVHVMVLGVLIVVYLFFGVFPSIYYINFIFYIPMMIIFMTGLTFLTASVSVLFKDLPPFIQSIMTPLFWATPILWLPPEGSTMDVFQKLVNPFYFFTSGYQDTFIKEVFFWERPTYILYFLALTFLIYVFGLLFYKRIRPLMADLI